MVQSGGSRPAPGTATEADVLIRPNGEKRLLELVDGVLVEKAMGYFESRLAAVLIFFLESFLEQNDIGFVLGVDARSVSRPVESGMGELLVNAGSGRKANAGKSKRET